MTEKRIIRDNVGVQELLKYLEDKQYVAFDCETTGVTSSAEIIGYSVAASEDLGWYVVTAYWDVDKQELVYLETKDSAPEVMKVLVTKDLIEHNGVFDSARVEENYKVPMIQAVHTDTMLAAHLANENRKCGLKDLAAEIFGESSRDEQIAVRASVIRNGGQLTKANYELYKADSHLLAEYGCQDAILTYRLFEHVLNELADEGMINFFYEETMPLLRSATYELNTTGLKIDMERLAALKKELEIESAELCSFIDAEITPIISEKYPATSPRTTFNIDSREMLAWLLFEKLGERFVRVSDAGADLCAAMQMRRPYTNKSKIEFIETVKHCKGAIWREKDTVDRKTGKKRAEAKVKDYWTYLSVDKAVLATFEDKYSWVKKLLQLKKVDKLLGTYVLPLERQQTFSIIHPQFLQNGTTSGRFSCKNPNFQTLPRDDKRLKACVVSRPGKVFVGSDYSQLEPRVFASFSNDERLLACFKTGTDFYSVIGTELFNKRDCSLFKSHPDFFGKKYESLRNKSKVVALSATYGTTASKMAPGLGVDVKEAQEVIDNYFENFPSVKAMMVKAHDTVKKQGYVQNLYGRKRRIPRAMDINKVFGNVSHDKLPYEARTLLNLGMNHIVQSTAASIANRASIRFSELCKEANIEARTVLVIHDEIVVECADADADDVVVILKEAMEHAVELPGVSLVAEPRIAKNLADLK